MLDSMHVQAVAKALVAIAAAQLASLSLSGTLIDHYFCGKFVNIHANLTNSPAGS